MHSLIAISNSQDLIAYGYGLLWPQVMSELVITSSYYAIPLSLAYFICQRKDFPCPWLMKLFAGFTVACGITQMLGGFSYLKIFTAFIAIITVLLVFWLIRQTLTSSHPAQLKAETAQSKQKVIEYQTFIKHSTNGFWCCDINGRFLDVNDALCNMLGYSEQELLTMSIMDIEAIETTEETVARIQHIMKTGHGCFETQHRRKDGRIIDVEIDTCFLTALESRFFVFITDISHRKQAEQEKRVNEERLRTFYQLDLVGLSITSPEKGWISANGCLCKMLEYSEHELRQKTWAELTHPDDIALSFEPYAKLLANELNGYTLEKRFISRTGKIIYARIVVRCTRKADGTVDIVNTMIDDISGYKRTEMQLRIAATVFESHEGMFITDTHRVIINVNRAFTQITGYSAAEAIGQTPQFLRSEQHDPAFYEALWQNVQETGTWQGEIWNQRKNGEFYPKWLRITAVKDDTGTVTNYAAAFTDISERKITEQTINQLEFYDSLTQLPNRRLLNERLKHAVEVSYRTGERIALLMLDLDKFKSINDHFGHTAGDELLQQVAKRIKSCLHEVDMVARLGGDEFVVLLEAIEHDETVARLAETIIQDLNQPFSLSQGDDVIISTSIGIALYPQHGDSVETLMDNVDAALYHAKDQGRGRFAYFSDELTQTVRERLALENRLRRTIEQQELRVYFQAQIDISSGRIIGAEALVRWIDPIHGFTPPNQFIPLAEETGLIIPLGEWVLRETCRLGQQWLNAGLPPISLAVNVSPYQFSHSDINALVTNILNETGFPVHLLELEITESGLMKNQQQAMAILDALHSQGVRLAIDDFGTGYSSLSYLKFFPLDVLKIDKSFIDDIPFLASDVAITSTIIAMAHHLGFKVLAEGVETQAQLDFLIEHGCDMYQGYFYSKPIPAEDFAKLLSKSD